MARRSCRRRGRRPRRQLLWIRDAVVPTVTLPATDTFQSLAVDLLWKTRNPNPATAGEFDGTPFAGYGLGQGPINLTGATVLRIRLDGVAYAVGTPSHSEGYYYGITAGDVSGRAVQSAIMPDTESFAPGGVNGASRGDWMWWERKYTLELASVIITNGTTNNFYSHFHVNTRVRRKIEDWGDTLVWLGQTRQSGTGGNSLSNYSVALSWSVLVALP